MKSRYAVLPFVILLAACAPAAQPSPSTPFPATETSLASPMVTSTHEPLVIDTVSPTQVPTKGITADDGRLGLAEAQELVRNWYEQQGGGLRAALSEEITPEGALQQLGVQVIRTGEWPGSSSTSSYLIYDRQVWLLGFASAGEARPDILLADLDQDGSPELVDVFAYTDENASIRVFHILDGGAELLDLDWLYPGDLALRQEAGGQVQVLGLPSDGGPEETLGVLTLQGESLSLDTDPGQGTMRATYRSPSLGLSFQYPPDWEEVEPGRYQGVDGFFQVSPVESTASGLSDAYHRLSFRMVRACTWEASAILGQYGQDPKLRLLSDIPGRAQCLITPGADARQDSPVLLIETPGGGLALLRADPRQMEVIQRTLVYYQAGGQSRPGEEYPHLEAAPAPELDLQTSQMGELTLEEYRWCIIWCILSDGGSRWEIWSGSKYT